jgi:hypothetical protein
MVAKGRVENGVVVLSEGVRLPEGQEVTVLAPLAPAVDLSEIGGTPEDRGWPPGYFEKTFGSITDETFVRPPQGDLPKPVDLE